MRLVVALARHDKVPDVNQDLAKGDATEPQNCAKMLTCPISISICLMVCDLGASSGPDIQHHYIIIHDVSLTNIQDLLAPDPETLPEIKGVGWVQFIDIEL